MALEGGEVSASRPGRSLPPIKTRYPLYRRLGGPQGRSGQVRKISHPTGIRSPDRQARSQSLYRLSYPTHRMRWSLHLNKKFLMKSAKATTALDFNREVLDSNPSRNTGSSPWFIRHFSQSVEESFWIKPLWRCDKFIWNFFPIYHSSVTIFVKLYGLRYWNRR